MPAKKRPKPLYQRGDFALYHRADRENLEIIWYDADRKRERSFSAGTPDVGQGKLALDRRYLTQAGHRTCPTCHRPWDQEGSPLLSSAIADYLILSEDKAGFGSAKNRLGHVVDYIAATDATITCAAIDVSWVDAFRKWLLAKPIVSPKLKIERPRKRSHVEGCVLQLAAVINATPGHRTTFQAEQATSVSDSPTYRADIKTLAAMFQYALAQPHRANLLAYLRMAVATWARPDAIYDVMAVQWVSAANVLDLNPPGRKQTTKHRPRVPIAKQFAPWLDDMGTHWLPVSTIRGPWDKMCLKLGLPGDGQSGQKLIRRSIATIARKRIGEANWIQGRMMLGHVKTTISDIYALPDPANLGLALTATEAIIDDIEKLAPGAFYRANTAKKVPLTVVNGGKYG